MNPNPIPVAQLTPQSQQPNAATATNDYSAVKPTSTNNSIALVRDSQESQRRAAAASLPAPQVDERSEFLKREIKAFLDDKKLLRQLEEQPDPQGSNKMAITLMKSQIVSKSANVTSMIAELNERKQ